MLLAVFSYSCKPISCNANDINGSNWFETGKLLVLCGCIFIKNCKLIFQNTTFTDLKGSLDQNNMVACCQYFVYFYRKQKKHANNSMH